VNTRVLCAETFPACLVSHVRNDDRLTSIYEALDLDDNRLDSFEVALIEAQGLVEPR
jgi:hypothetical protein